MTIDINEYRDKKYPYISEEEVWNSLINLNPETMMIITKVDGKLRVANIRMARFEIKTDQLIEENQ